MLFGLDLLHLVIMGTGMLLSLAASGYVRYKFNSGKAVALRSRMTGAAVARAILEQNGVHDVQVREHQGFLSDHYSPTEKTLNLSPDVFHGTHAAAAGVAAHEVGHALQHAHGDLTMWGRTILVYPAHFGSMLAPWLIILGIMLSAGHSIVPGTWQHSLALAGVGLFAVALACALFIVFNEFNASARARTALATMGITVSSDEDAAVRGVLLAAGLTYVAAAIYAAMELLYWAYRAGLIGGRRD
jgi:Zn-dependent membrane protease YugP